MKLKTALAILLLFFLSHLPFLDADPGKDVDVHTMGAWTDEGLYAAQARNFVNYGDFGLHENTTMIRGPMQSLLQVPLFYFFGPSRLAVRLLTLLWICAIILIFILERQWRFFSIIFVILALGQFRVFHFSHYAMAEMMANSSLLLSFLFLSKFIQYRKIKFVILSALMVFLAWSLKIQYVYFIIIPPAAIFFGGLVRRRQEGVLIKKVLYNLGLITAALVAFALLYIILWYLPNKEFFDLVMFKETASRFDSLDRIHLTIDFNFRYFILKPENYALLLATILALLVWMGSFLFKQIKIENHFVIVFALIWLLIELHKLGMTYLPQRYLLGLYLALGFFASAVLFQFWERSRFFKAGLLVLMATAMVFNGYYYLNAYQKRTYELTLANRYLQNYDWDGKTMAGVWAPSVSWGTHAKVVPVWIDYNDPKTFFKKYQPRIIVTEPNEGSCGRFFRDHGYDLEMMSDSVRYFDAWRYDFEIFWLKATDEP